MPTTNGHLLSGDLLDQVRVADLLDIGIVAVLLYVVLVWLRNRASRTLGLVSTGLVLLFLLARWLDLYLTTMFFHYGLVGIALAIVVVFQQDIRHGFERLASFRLFRQHSPNDSRRRLVETITEVADEMAQKRIGALIVFPGREPLDRHIHGGVSVDAKISLPLLLSIFHPKSPGHDGAVLIESDRIMTLGMHLPLTTQVERVHDCGTRHAAALGLAERCDALVVAVSEERGTITVAQDAEMTEVDPADLADHLRRYFDTQDGSFDAKGERRLSDWATGLAALSAATALWFAFAYHTDIVQRTFAVPIEFRNIPPDYEIAEPKPNFAEATLSGPEPTFAMLDPTRLAVSLEIREEQGKTIFRWFTADSLTNLPEDLRIESTVPAEIVVSLRPKLDESQ
ncbi:diadenylate cyclase [Stieleria varia]|uniref:Diadenylate cyclase n=1 Tax=Stieleria varia TaxID=2528005 RepID=A0A5C6AU19_9BACT|nr:diadenylate cyclase [Stieleria varia]TWU02546.1 DNA integrity scanning protein DisA [Stieleria varia]